MPGQKLSLDPRNLPAAALDSCRFLPPLLRDLVERAAVAFKRCFLAGQCLPALDDHIRVLRIKLQPIADTLGQLRGREGCPATKERVIYQFGAPEVIQN